MVNSGSEGRDKIGEAEYEAQTTRYKINEKQDVMYSTGNTANFITFGVIIDFYQSTLFQDKSIFC